MQLGFDDMKDKHTTKPMKGHFEKVKSVSKRYVKEIRTTDKPAFEAGATITVQVLEGAKNVDVSGVSKGKGWAGVMKKWHFRGQGASHGNTKHHRRGGSLGRTYSVHKGVPKNHHMPGQMGNKNVTVRGLEVVKIMPEENILLVKGSVPGCDTGYLFIKQSQKDPAYKP